MEALPTSARVAAPTAAAVFSRQGSADSSVSAVSLARAPLLRLADVLVRPWVYWLFHSWRLFGYMYWLPPMLLFWPRRTLAVLGCYGLVHRRTWWQRGVHRFFRYGASKRHCVVNPSKHLIRDDKRYLWALHPHSILADGWHSCIAARLNSFEGQGPPGVDRSIALCFAPIIQHVPVHQEMYRDKCGSADQSAILKWWATPDTDPALIPGGFAESVFANAMERRYEYSYIKDRKGFVRICIQAGKDIVPCYTFRSSWMYNNPGILKGLRARFSQRNYVGLVLFFGRWGTSMPLIDDTTTVIFPPFEASKYSSEQVDEAHSAYLVHLKKYFDQYKGQYGMDGVELVFVGNDFVDDDPVAKGLRRLGVLSNQATGSLEPDFAADGTWRSGRPEAAALRSKL